MNGRFSALRRQAAIDRLTDKEYDVLIIGGGITGAGIALDATSRGMKTALIDMQDFGAGTSSRSTKLVHGGLRYLKQFEVKLVAEVGKERAVVYGNAPHVTTPEWMLLPIYKGGTFGKLTPSAGLWLYDWLAGVKRQERRNMLNVQETMRKEPLLREEGLLGSGIYVEYRTDDARLTIEAVKKAAALGAEALNYVKAAKLLYNAANRLNGVLAEDRWSGHQFEIRAKQIVNAAGPWVDEIREWDRSRQGKTLRLTKGVHLVFDHARFPLQQAIYFDVPDGRMMFAIPRDGKTYIGTTDTDFEGDPAAPDVTEEDRAYIVAAANAMFPSLELAVGDEEAEWSGVRPLIYEEGKSPSEISRKDEVFRSPSGLITIAGGKLTGYRKMAENVSDLLARELNKNGRRSFGPCVTRTLTLSGGDFGGVAKFPEFVREQTEKGVSLGLTPKASESLARRYGTNVSSVFAYLSANSTEQQRHGLPPALYAALRYSMDEEMAVAPADFLLRRSGLALFDIHTARLHYRSVLQVMGEVLGWSETQMAEHEAETDAIVQPQQTARG